MTNHKEIGTIGESMVITEVLRNGNSVFLEFGDNCKVDLIIMDSTGTLHKIQVKTSNREVNKPDVTLLYMHKSGPNGHRYTYTEDDVDWFAVVDLQTSKIAWIRCSDINSSQVSLRHSGKLQKNSRNFDDYVKYPFN